MMYKEWFRATGSNRPIENMPDIIRQVTPHVEALKAGLHGAWEEYVAFLSRCKREKEQILKASFFFNFFCPLIPYLTSTSQRVEACCKWWNDTFDKCSAEYKQKLTGFTEMYVGCCSLMFYLTFVQWLQTGYPGWP